MLFVTPNGYQEAERDVIRLSPDIAHIQQQQGYITCAHAGPFLPGHERHSLHCAVKVTPAEVRQCDQQMLAPTAGVQ